MLVIGGLIIGVGLGMAYESWRDKRTSRDQSDSDDHIENLRRNYHRSQDAAGPLTPPLEMPKRPRGRPRKPQVEEPRQPLVFTKPSRRAKVN